MVTNASSENIKNVPLKYCNVSLQQCENMWFSKQSIHGYLQKLHLIVFKVIL